VYRLALEGLADLHFLVDLCHLVDQWRLHFLVDQWRLHFLVDQWRLVDQLDLLDLLDQSVLHHQHFEMW
jgi:hypothetical protein